MSNKKVDIEEMIADAKAEEEVAAEQAKAAREEKASEDFREKLREQLKDVLTSKHEEAKVTISLAEYTTLKFKEMDLDRILNAIVDDFKLNYSKEYLRLDGDRIEHTFRSLYPDMYDAVLAAELENAASEGE